MTARPARAGRSSTTEQFGASTGLARLMVAPVSNDAAVAAADRIADCLALCLAARTKSVVEAVREHVLEAGGAAVAAAVGGRRVPADSAALVNGTAAHALGLDDFHAATGIHPMVTVIPAALAAAESAQAPGTDLLRAVLVGYEVACRLGRTCAAGAVHRRGFHLTSVFGAVAATAAAATALGLTARQAADGMTIAATRAAGLVHFGPDATTKPLQTGWAAAAGVGAALLARRGARGPADLLEARGGLLWAVAGDSAYDTAPLFVPAREWTIRKVAFKPYAHSTNFHTAIDIAMELVSHHRVNCEDIERVQVMLPAPVADDLITSLEHRRRPAGTREAQQSLPFAMGVALANAPNVRPSDTFYDAFGPDRLADPRVLRVAAIVSIEPDPLAATSNPQESPASVTITTRNGRQLTGRRRSHRGSPDRPFTRAEFVERIAGLAGPAPDLVALTERLPGMKRITELADVLLEPTHEAGEVIDGRR